LQATFSDVENLVGAVCVRDSLAERLLLGAQIFARDQTSGVILTAVDLETSAEAFERLTEAGVILAQDALSDK